MTEPYNMSQAQRDAAHIAALEKQIQDMTAIVRALCSNTTHVQFHLGYDPALHSDWEALLKHVKADMAHQAANFVLNELHDRGQLYHRLAQYEQWFYTKNNYTTRIDALRSTMTVARP